MYASSLGLWSSQFKSKNKITTTGGKKEGKKGKEGRREEGKEGGRKMFLFNNLGKDSNSVCY